MSSNKGGQLANNDVLSALEDMFDASVIESQQKASYSGARKVIFLAFQQSESPMWIPRLKLTKGNETPTFISTKEPFNVYQEVLNKKGESKLAILPVLEYHGWIMFAEYDAGIKEWDPANKVMHTHCQTMGCAPQGTKVNAIFYPIRSMYQYDKDNPYRKPSDDVANKLHPFGSRNEWCTDCILNGHSIVPSIVDPTKTLRCKAWGYMYMMVTSVTVQDGEDIVRINVKELFNSKSEPLNYFPLGIDLNSSSIQGAFNQGIVGAAQVHEDTKLVPYKYTLGMSLKDIPRLGNDPESAKARLIHYRPYTVRAVFKENPATGEKSQFSQGHFTQDYDSRSDLSFVEQIAARQEEHDECLDIWKSIAPTREIQELNSLELGGYVNTNNEPEVSLKSAGVYSVDTTVIDTEEGWEDINLDIN